MTDSFDDLGLAPELAAAPNDAGWKAPTGLQRDAIPLIRRGNNVVLHASAGSGVTGAYGLGVLDRLAPTPSDDEAPDAGASEGPGFLVLVPDSDTASRTADSLSRLASAAGRTARALEPGWSDRPADLLVATPSRALAAVRGSALKLAGLMAVVVDGADRIRATGQWDDLETLIDTVPGDAQRVIVAGRFDPPLPDFLERHVRKALTIPPRSVDEDREEPTGETVTYRVVPDHDKSAALVPLIQAIDSGEVAVICRTPDRAEELERALDARGVLGRAGERTVLVLPRLEADRRSTQARVLSADVPLDAATLTALHGGGGTVLVTPREREHLLRIADRAGVPVRALPDPPIGHRTAADAVRDRIRALLEEGDLAADLALLEPLLTEHPAAEVAAAALHLARTGESAPGGSAARSARASAPQPGAAPAPTTTTWAHLFIAAGERDGVTPGDILGAITGEAGIDADRVGRIDIRESHTTAEVVSDVAQEVIRALNGRTLKGRSLRVDYDRKSGGGGDRPTGGRKPSGGRGGPGGSGSRPGGRSPRPGGRSPRPGGSGGPRRGPGGPRRGPGGGSSQRDRS